MDWWSWPTTSILKAISISFLPNFLTIDLKWLLIGIKQVHYLFFASLIAVAIFFVELPIQLHYPENMEKTESKRKKVVVLFLYIRKCYYTLHTIDRPSTFNHTPIITMDFIFEWLQNLSIQL